MISASQPSGNPCRRGDQKNDSVIRGRRLSLMSSPAHALVTSAWVSGKGKDVAGCGKVTAPCRTFQYVHDKIIAAGGEIDVLDPAGYGPIAITKALSIVNDGAGTAALPAAP